METLFPGIRPNIHTEPPQQFNESWFEDELQVSKSSSNYEKCSNCASENLEFEELLICRDCGQVLEQPLDSGAEFRFFGAEDRSSIDPCRIGAPTDNRFPSSTLGTMILARAQGGNSSNRMAMARVRRYHTWNLLPYKERSLLQVFEQLALAASNHGLDGRTIDIAKDLYIRLVEHCDRRGMSRTSVVASCIYSALKIVGQPRKPKEIADIFHLSSTQFTKCFKYFQEVISMANQRGLLENKHIPASLSSTRASDYIAHPLSRLPISRAAYMKIHNSAVSIATIAEDREICPENMPPSLAAGVLAYCLTHMGYADIKSERIASVCGVSEGTLLKCLRKLEATHETLKEYLESS